jgi:CRISPR-associated Csx2 family protein
MSHTLVSLLGKVKNPKYVDSNYRKANYYFSENNIETSRFFGLTLLKNTQVDKFTVLGTTGSMWDNLMLEVSLDKHYPHLEDRILKLGEDAHANQIQQADLDKFSDYMAEVLQVSCELKLIPYGRNPKEQAQTLQILMQSFSYGDQATLDVTHSLRHLPMLVQQSALLLQTSKSVKIHGIYYGALELTQNEQTPVMRLEGLLEINDWNQALAHYDKQGDYSVLIPVLTKSSLSSQMIDYLENAAFYEQTNNVQKARNQLKKFLLALKQHDHQKDIYLNLFLPALEDRFKWVNEDKLYQRQTAVAWLALEHGNLLRATLYGFEAFITYLVQKQAGNPDQYESREMAKQDYQAQRPIETWHSYKQLRQIRNRLAHSSTHSDAKIIQIVSKRTALQQCLQAIFTQLIPKEG